jgi:hypothetical protein
MVSRLLSRHTCCWVFVLVVAFLMSAPQIPEATESTFPLKVNVQNVTVTTAGDFSQVGISEKGYDYLTDPGQPALPFRLIKVLLPQDEVFISVRAFVNDRSTLVTEFHPVIAQPIIAEDGVVGKGAYLAGTSSDRGLFPETQVKYMGTGYLHGCAIASFAVFPFQIEDGNLVLNNDIEIRIVTELDTEDPGVVKRIRFREGFAQERRNMISSLVINPEELDRFTFNEVIVEKPRGGFQPTAAPSLEGSPVDYVIIAPDSFAAAFQPFADWKTAKGVPTVIRTTEWIQANYRNGVDLQETIRFFLQDAYSKWGIKWAMLGGDTPQLPPRYGYSSFYGGGKEMPVDLYFACLDGSWNKNHNNLWGEGYTYEEKDDPDLYAEVYVGRLPTTTVSEVNVMTAKIMSYESPCQKAYLGRHIFLAEVLFPVDWEEGEPISLNGADMAEFIYTTTLLDEGIDVIRMYETPGLYAGSVQENVQAALDSMEAGLNQVTHIGHGFRFNMSCANASIQVPEALALTNTCQLFNLYMLNCTAAAYDYNCLAEAFLENPIGGAASCVGANESAFPNAASYYMNEYYRLLYDEDFVHIGETFARSRLPRTPFAEDADNVDLWTHYIYTLLADPEMAMWTDEPDTFNVFHVSNVDLGTSQILVNVTAGGVPVDSAFVCLSKGIDDYQVAATNSLGNATIDFTSESPGSISVVITGFNVARHQSYIEVNSSLDAYLNLSDLSVDDDSTDTSYGNDDGVIDAGETIDFLLELVNTGDSASDSAWVVLRCDDPLVTIQDSIAAVGVIGAGNTKEALDPVRVVFSENAPDETAIEFDIVIYDMSVGEWHDSFTRLVHAPSLDLIALRVDDSIPPGNGSGHNDPNERFKLYYEIKNYGTGAANKLNAVLRDLDGAFVFYDSTVAYPDLASIEQAENTTGFDILETTTDVEHDLEITITDLYGRAYVDTFELRYPYPPSGLAFNVSIGVDRIEVSWQKSASSDVHRYRVYHSLDTGGPYQLRNDDPVDHTVYLDCGLSGNTRYYYVVTALDTSGNESGFSAEYSTSTNPPQMPGFPIEMRVETVSSPAAGDIDGDGDIEIVTGNNYVYAWHHDGLEMTDGDSDPQTWGVLNTHGLDYVAPVALADLDQVRGKEIIAASYSTREMFVFDYQGNILTGWPKTTEQAVRAAPVAGDLDGDGDLEVICVDQSAVIYAWHADGTQYRDLGGTDGVFYRTPAPGGWHYQTPALCDIDSDNMDEIVLGTLVDSVYVLNEDGSSVPGWPIGTNGDVAGSIAVGDIDDDGLLEMVVPTKSSEVKAYNHDGSVLWMTWVANTIFFCPSPALADFDEDGTLETVIAGSNKKLYVIKSNGAQWDGWPINYSTTTYTESSPVVADIDGNGVVDIVLGDESKFMNAWDINGDLLPGFPIATGDFVRATPAICDIDFDSDAEIIFSGWDKYVYVWDLIGFLHPDKLPWPTFHGNIHRDGNYESKIISGIVDALVTHQVLNGVVELVWSLPESDVYRYDLYRGETVNDITEEFVRIAADLAADVQGRIQLSDNEVEMGRRYLYKLERSGRADEYLLSDQIYIPISRGELFQNYPNPFNPSTRIEVLVPEGSAQNVTLAIYDVSGAKVRTLVNSPMTPGRYISEWDGRNDLGNPVGSGVYFYQMRQKGFSDTKKMLLLK